MADVRLEQVRKVYPDGHVAVHGATFEVADGELMVLVGPSGCGKSTLLRMIAGLEEISGGTLSIGGRVVNDVAPKDRDIAMVFQNYALYPQMTVAENLAFGLKLRGIGKAEAKQRIDAAAETLGLAGLLGKLPKELSGGQRQRVALGRALVREPKVFLLDEPLSNLDAKLRNNVRSEIARLHRRLGATMVYVTHDQVEAMTLGQRIVVLNEGVVQQIDTPMALYERPANLFVAGFLGSPAMNFLRGDAAKRFSPHGGRDVVLGIRPEHLRLSAGEGALRAQVELVEPVGSESFVHLRSGDHALVARVEPDRAPAVGDTAGFDLAIDRLHFFDAESGLRLM
ncbi:sn-glycerol-3-phosphate ABC transporter ATP-binding protein UgpC [Pseudoxanthomonas sangjuensis]|uniref:ABC transporter ATP-binding protein n=1 Tax=Pseudoxanthomonas sangjuensis TaxID=1503750 RepID=UPI001390A5FC|nr:sn-glycerol-3-phosphate ABC transporter ATP-binding protein UgpC [Pseudoxanthomonas sangjuensis]KAF1715808.1 sn-glycerol-3-phosphate ABC transporter ATP-binding protein UgpC [Pseudoxanthomonas sangjuensis]